MFHQHKHNKFSKTRNPPDQKEDGVFNFSCYDRLPNTSTTTQNAPRPPILLFLLATGAVFLHLAIILATARPIQLVIPPPTQNGQLDSFPNHTQPFTAPPRILPEIGYSSGKSSVYWLGGSQYGDYPFSCRCDPAKYEEFKAGGTQGQERKAVDEKPGFFKKLLNGVVNTDTKLKTYSSGVVCSGSDSKALLASSTPFCDAINAGKSKEQYMVGVVMCCLSVHLLSMFVGFED